MQVFRSILAWCDKHDAAAEFPAMFSAVRTHHLETFECRSLLVRQHVRFAPACYRISCPSERLCSCWC